MPNGLYWYHSHRHTMTSQQTYAGLAGLLEIGRPDGNLPLVTQNNIPVRDMAIQYNYVFDRNGKGHQLNNYSWPQCVSTLKPPEGSQLADGTYQPSLAPVNIAETSDGRPVPHPVVGRAAVAAQQSRPDAVHPVEPDELRQPDDEDHREPGAAGQSSATCSSPSTASSSRS